MGKMGEGQWELQASCCRVSQSGAEGAAQGIRSVGACVVTDGSYTRGKHSIAYTVVKSLRCTLKTHVSRK